MIKIYLHLGQDTVVKTANIIGIFEMDTSTVSIFTRKYLEIAEKRKRVINVSFELPKSFVVVNEEGKIMVYITQLSSSTLQKRAEQNKLFDI